MIRPGGKYRGVRGDGVLVDGSVSEGSKNSYWSDKINSRERENWSRRQSFLINRLGTRQKLVMHDVFIGRTSILLGIKRHACLNISFGSPKLVLPPLPRTLHDDGRRRSNVFGRRFMEQVFPCELFPLQLQFAIVIVLQRSRE